MHFGRSKSPENALVAANVVSLRQIDAIFKLLKNVATHLGVHLHPLHVHPGCLGH